MNRHEHHAKAPSAKSGLFATLAGRLRGRGSGAPAGGRRASLTLAVVLTLAALLALSAAPAQAASFPPLGEITGPGPGESFGKLLPESVAADDHNGHIYVADSGAHRVYDFESAADTSPAVWDGSATPAGSFGGGRVSVAIDNSSGDVYVADATHAVIDKFEQEGSLIASFGDSLVPDGQLAGSATPAGPFSPDTNSFASFGIAVDQASHDLYVIDAGHEVIDVFDEGGTYLEQFTEKPGSLYGCAGEGRYADGIAANDKSGELLVSDSCDLKTYRFDLATGAFLAAIDGSVTPAGSFGGLFTSVAAENSSGDVYVADSSHEVVDQLSADGSAYVGQITELPFINGVAVDQQSGDIYVSLGAGVVKIFGSGAGFPTVETKAASGIGPHEATLEGTVNPNEVPLTECFFEWGETESYGHTAPCHPSTAEIDSGPLGAPVAVHADITGLEAGATYHFRLEAANANGQNEGNDETFETPPPPSIDAAAAENLTEHTVDLNTEINPHGSETSCEIQWGPTVEPGNPALPYESTDECEPFEIGAGGTDVPASLHLTGLSKDTSYHWRVLATNSSGTTTGVEHTFVFLGPPPHESCPANEAFRTGASAALPDCRAYEMVTPPNKNGALPGDVFLGVRPAWSADGSRLILTSLQCFADASSCIAQRNGEGSSYAFSRTAAGWATSALSPPATQFAVTSSITVAPDTGMALFSIPTPPHGEDDLYARAPDGSLADLGPVTYPPLGRPGTAGSSYLATADLSHVVVEQSEEQVGFPFDEGGANGVSIYEYAPGNTEPFLANVSGKQGSTALISQCRSELGAGRESAATPFALSADGRTVFFTANPCATGTGENAGKEVPADELYARVDGELPDAHTVHISARSPSECSGECAVSPPADALFQGASVDGSKAFFTSTQQLTDEADQGSEGLSPSCVEAGGAGCNLYLYDLANPAGHNLIDVSHGDTSGKGPGVQGLMAFSPDGSHAYFVANGVLAANEGADGTHASPGDCSVVAGEGLGSCNLYLYQRDGADPAGQTTFIATLPGIDAPEWRYGPFSANVTPDGRFLLFASHAHLTPDDSASTEQIFRYDAQSGQLTRISIGERGFNDNGNASVGVPSFVPANALHGFPGGSDRPNPSMSNDGQRVFFMSPVGLTPGALNDARVADRNGEPQYAENVYEYHAGNVSLISDGRDTTSVPPPPCAYTQQNSSVCLLGTDASGNNVFFSTADQLVSQDTDTGVDYYDARVEGGFAADSGTTPCQGDACPGPGTAEAQSPAPASAGFNGREEDANHPYEGKCRKGFARKHGKCVKKSHKKKSHKSHKSHKRAGVNQGGKR